VRLANHPLLDALCGEYLVGTMRGGARRRFEAALRNEPVVAQRLGHWEMSIMPRYSESIEVHPPRRVWKRLARDLELFRYRAPWHRRVGPWRAWAAIASAAFLVLLFWTVGPRHAAAPEMMEIARLSGSNASTSVTAQLSRDGRLLVLKAGRPVIAGPNQSYELWLIPGQGAAPISVAVLGNLDASLPLAPERSAQLRVGAALAISAEPAGGSPTGQPTGAVIFSGPIAL